MLLFALSVARLISPAHDGTFDGAVAPSTARLWTSATHRLALTVPRLVPQQRDLFHTVVEPWARQTARHTGCPLQQESIGGGIGGQSTANELLTCQADPIRKAREHHEIRAPSCFVAFLISPGLPVIRRNS